MNATHIMSSGHTTYTIILSFTQNLNIIIIIIIFIIYKAQYPKMLKALYNKIKSYLLCVKTSINNNKYNCKIYFQIKTNVETLNYSLYAIKYYIQLTTMSKINK